MAKKAGMATGVEVARISVKVSPDTKQFRRDLKNELEEIERTIKGEVHVKAHLDSAQARADFQRMKEQMQRDGRVKVAVDTVPGKDGASSGSKSSGGKGGSDTADDVGRIKKLFQGLTDKLAQAPSFGSGINLTGWLLVLTAIAAVLAPLVGLITAALLALPGLLSLVLTPIGAIMLGLDGMKKAAETLAAPFQQLKDVMSGAVQDQFTPVFERLKAIFPTLEASMPKVSQGLADMLGSVVDTVTSSVGLERINSIISGIGGALSAASPGIGAFTDAMLTLTDSFVNGGALEGLVGWFNQAMTSFSNFMRQLEASGELDQIFQSLGAALKIVADVLGKIAMVGLETLTDPEAMTSFLFILKAVGMGLVYTMVASKALLNALTVGAQMVAAAWEWVKTSFTTLGQAIAAVGSTLANIWTTAVAAAQAAWNVITSTVQTAISTVLGVVTTLGSNLGAAWEAVKAGAAAAFNGMVSVIQSAWEAASAAVSAGVAAVVSFVSQLPGQIMSALGDLGGLLVASGKALIEGFISGIKSMVGAAVDAAKSVVSAVRNLFPFSPAKEGPFSGKGWVYYSGQSVGQGFADGITDSTKPAVEAAKELATRIKEAIDSGTIGDGMFDSISPEELKQYIDALEMERKRLKLDKNSISDKEGKKTVQNQMDQLTAYKDILSYQKDRLKNEKSYNSEVSGEDPFVKAASGLMKAPGDFFAATGKQFMSDIGIGGDGLIGNAITEGIKYIFNIGSVDEALSIKDREDSKAALPMIGR